MVRGQRIIEKPYYSVKKNRAIKAKQVIYNTREKKYMSF
jgi:hypothetical protein